MGVKGLWRLIGGAEEKSRLDQLGGQTVAVDLAIWLCGDMMVKYNSNVTLKLYVRNLFFRLSHLLLHDVLPVGVCDGAAPDLKRKTMEKRQGTRGKAQSGKSTARSHFRRISTECRVMLDCLGVPSLESPGEAEALCALLNSRKLVDACLTSDGDVFLYGAETVYSGMTLAQGDAHVSVFRSARILASLGLDRGRMVLLALLLGCDMTGGEPLPGVKKKEAVQWVRSLGEDVDVLRFLRVGDAGSARGLDLDILQRVRERLDGSQLPWREIVDEFLGNEEWSLPRRRFSWSRPQPEKMTVYCRRHLDWEEAYTLGKVLPLVAHWDLQHPHLPREPSLEPLRLIRRRQVRFVPSFEVEWRRFGFDSWHSADTYVFTVPQHPFAEVHPELLIEFEAANKRKRQPRAKKSQPTPEKEEDKSEEQLVAGMSSLHLLKAFHLDPATPSRLPELCVLQTSLVATPPVPENSFDAVDTPPGLRQRLGLGW